MVTGDNSSPFAAVSVIFETLLSRKISFTHTGETDENRALKFSACTLKSGGDSHYHIQKCWWHVTAVT